MIESELPDCGPPARFSFHLSSTAVSPAGYVHKSRVDKRCAYVDAVEEMMCGVCVGVKVFTDVDACILLASALVGRQSMH